VPEKDSREDPAAGATFWSGTISFGLVSVPVNLLAANRQNRTSLRMISPSGRPLSRRYFTSRDERELDWDQIVRGYEVEKDRYVVVSDEELERLAPERTRDIDLRVFVKASEIKPIYFERAYYLTPAGTSTKAYRLLARVMEETDRAGIATFVMRAKEYLVAILAENGILRAETLRFADEVRTPEDIGLPEPVPPDAAEVKRIEKAISGRVKKALETRELLDRSAERLLEVVERKVGTGKDVIPAADADEDDGEGEESRKVIDLMEMLQRSLQGGTGGSSRRGGKADGLEGSSKAELYERAKTLDIPGRSGMSKDELVRAIRESA
jgi:DNA end-binding protein Ku